MPDSRATKPATRRSPDTTRPRGRRNGTIGWLPAGFRMTDESYGRIPPGADAVDHRVYSDGLASLSIFIEPAFDAGDRIEGPSSVGAVNAYSRIIDEYQLSVVGEVPGIAVERVAASITKR